MKRGKLRQKQGKSAPPVVHRRRYITSYLSTWQKNQHLPGRGEELRVYI